MKLEVFFAMPSCCCVELVGNDGFEIRTSTWRLLLLAVGKDGEGVG